MTYLDALVQVFKWLGYLTWLVISVPGSILCILDITSQEPYKYSKEYLILCLVSFIFMVAFIVYKMSNR